MLLRLPDFVDPWRLADVGKRLEGDVSLGRFSRLAQLVLSSAGDAVYTLDFFRDRQKRACVKLHVSAAFDMQCQRCMQAMRVEVESHPHLVVVEGIEEAEQLPEELEPLMLEKGRLRPLELLEDEILLALPQVPMHAEGECAVKLATAPMEEVEPKAGEQEENPFAALAALKRHDA